MKEHISFICKTAFLEIRRISTSLHYLTGDAIKTLVVSLVLSRIDYCNSLLAGLPQSLVVMNVSGPVDYRINVDGKVKIFHVNMLSMNIEKLQMLA